MGPKIGRTSCVSSNPAERTVADYIYCLMAANLLQSSDTMKDCLFFIKNDRTDLLIIDRCSVGDCRQVALRCTHRDLG